jgi:hypothetical protein
LNQARRQGKAGITNKGGVPELGPSAIDGRPAVLRRCRFGQNINMLSSIQARHHSTSAMFGPLANSTSSIKKQLKERTSFQKAKKITRAYILSRGCGTLLQSPHRELSNKKKEEGPHRGSSSYDAYIIYSTTLRATPLYGLGRVPYRRGLYKAGMMWRGGWCAHNLELMVQNKYADASLCNHILRYANTE